MYTLPERFTLGGRLTAHELNSAYLAIHQRTLPKGAFLPAIALELTTHHPDQFDIEVNRMRGYIINQPEMEIDHACIPQPRLN